MSFSTSEVANAVAKRVAELSDRSSPDDWPEAMLVTAEELIFIVQDELHEAFSAAISQSQIEEPRSGDTVRAEDQSASLTHKNNLGTVELTDD